MRYLLCSGILLTLFGCGWRNEPRIALVPMTTGSNFWEAEHAGAHAASLKLKCQIYWNAPTREDDIEGQVELLQRISGSRKYQGLVLAPDHALAVLAPLRRALAAGIPTVIIVSPLALEPNDTLSYIITDEDHTGRMAALRIGSALHGTGSVAVLGIDPGITGMMLRLQSLERCLDERFPNVHLVARGAGAFNAAEAQEATLAVLSANPQINAVFSMTNVSTRAAFFALKSSNQLGKVKLIGCDQDLDMLQQIRTGAIDSILGQDTYRMGFEAVNQIWDKLQGKPMPGSRMLAPVLITRDNVDSPEIQHLTDVTWFDHY